MKRLVLTTLISIVTFCAFAQSINLSFTGQTIRGRHVDMDSIAIRNLTQGWSVTLVAPDTACAFTLNGITLHSADAIGLSQNVPNPFHGTTEVNLALPKPDKVTMQAFDMGGRVFANYNGNLPEGEHRFAVSLASPQSYLLSANTSDGTSSIKMVNLGSGGTNSITYIGQVAEKALRDGELEINYGDNLQFAGYTTYIGAVYESEATIVSINSDSDVEQPIVFNLKSGSFDEIIACDSYTWVDGVTYRESNHTATYTYTNSMDCDSVVTLHLTINYSVNATDTHIACGTFTWIDGVTYTENNNSATFTLQTTEGCDSIVTLNLTIGHPETTEFYETACDNYVWNGVEYTESGDYTQTLQSFAGCDSIVTLHLTIVNSVLNMISETVCDSYEWNGQTYSEDGIYSQTFTAANGCDSVVKLNLTVLHSVNNEFYESACDTYDWNGEMFSLTGDYIRTFNAANGCDSIVTLHLTIERSETDDEIVACEQYTWINGVTYTESNNTAIYTLTNTAGCDSIVALHLTITTTPEVHTSAIGSTNYRSAVCGGTVVLEGNQVTSYGICWSTEYNPTIDDAHTSEAVISDTFTSTMTGLEPSTTYYVRAYATNLCGTFYGEQKMLTTCSCGGQITDARDGNQYSTVLIGDQCWTAENLKYMPNWHSVDLDSIEPRYCIGRINNYTFESVYSLDEALQSQYYLRYGVQYNWAAVMAGRGSSDLNPSGVQGVCPNGWHVPSINEFIELESALPEGDVASQLAGNASIWLHGSLTQSEHFGESGFNALPGGGIGGSAPSEESAVFWTSSSYLFANATRIRVLRMHYNSTNIYLTTDFFNYQLASVRCVKDRIDYDCCIYMTDTIDACDSLTWRNGITYTASNRTATYRIAGENGCDTIYSLRLTIYRSNETTDNIDACESYTWIDGNTYTENNDTATYMLQNIHGCDSLVHLNLRIHHTSQDVFVDTRTACDSLVWIDGNTYYEDNDEAITTVVTPAGCDSVVRLNLTVVHSVEYEFEASSCDDYVWDGRTYSSSGDYTRTYTAANGCDSIVTMHYTRLDNYVYDTIYACASYTWINGETYTIDDITSNPLVQYIRATYTYTNSHSCDSTIEMRLFLQADNVVDTHRACESFTWIDGNTYTESNNTAMVTLTNQYGCDSVVHLNLTIGHSDNTVHEVTAEECAYYQMSNGEYFTENGDYHRTLQSSCGCDSIVLLHLTITCENGNEGTFYDERDSITYRIIEYNGLTWFAEDLRTTHFTDGTEAPRTSGDMYVYYKSEWGHWGDIANQNGYYDRDYGYYYNRRGYNFCPEGWRLPTQSEWQNLINTMRAYGDYGCGGNGDAIKSMVSTSNWNESDVECTAGYFQETNNSRGLGLNPDGVVTLLREHHGFIYGGNEVSAYLTSSSSIAILYNSTDIIYDSNPYDNDSYIYYNNIFGVHIRCVRDN
ncbi:MAG: hypothetical protein IKP45_10625 [Bacteroidales bacterium]|nr:hypothetical protein [Bacteroidales bacterium]